MKNVELHHVHTRYNHPNPVVRFTKPSMTDPQFLQDSDINHILHNYRVGLPIPTRSGAQSLDCTQFGDFAQCLAKVKEGTDKFMALPSELRAKFGHDPKAFFNFVSDPANCDEVVRLGLGSLRTHEPDAIELLKEISEKVTPKGDN